MNHIILVTMCNCLQYLVENRSAEFLIQGITYLGHGFTQIMRHQLQDQAEVILILKIIKNFQDICVVQFEEEPPLKSGCEDILLGHVGLSKEFDSNILAILRIKCLVNGSLISNFTVILYQLVSDLELLSIIIIKPVRFITDYDILLALQTPFI